MEIISSISYNQEEIIENILKLHVPQGYIDCDCTYSKGNFYKSGKIKQPIYKFDKFPQTDDTIQSDATNLPLQNESINCLMFDPPFVISKGKSLQEYKEGSNIIHTLSEGFYPKDLFILMAKQRLISGKVKNQQHARKFHSYFLVFEKKKSKIDYNEFMGDL